MLYERQYAVGAGADVITPIHKPTGHAEFADSGDWTPATGEVKISLDGGAAANIATLPVFVTSIGWKFVFSNAELTAARINVTISSPANIEDSHFLIETKGDASAQHQDVQLTDLIDGVAFSTVMSRLNGRIRGRYTFDQGTGRFVQYAEDNVTVLFRLDITSTTGDPV